jgi:hypothetical protein
VPADKDCKAPRKKKALEKSNNNRMEAEGRDE